MPSCASYMQKPLMDQDVDYAGLVRQAQLGDRKCLERLSGVVGRRLRIDVYRLTLRHDLTDDIVQETILEMLKVLGKLKKADRFWPWLYSIALNKLRSHHRKQKRGRTAPLHPADVEHNGGDAMSDLVTRELKQVVVSAMGKLKPEHRAVLTMRCYREMEYSLIAEALGCSDLAAKMLFYRAKKALQRHLSHQGFGKGSLLMALIVFGKVTAPSEAAAGQISVTAAATKVGLGAGLLGAITSKTTLISLAAAGALATGTVVVRSGADTEAAGPRKRPVVEMPVQSQMTTADNAVGEYSYYFPEGAGGPLMMRLAASASRGHGHCSCMQDEQANYYYDAGANVILINNYRLWNADLAVWRLPTDEPTLTLFVSQVEGRRIEMEHVSTDMPGLMVVVGPGQNGTNVWTTRHWHVVDEEYFRYNWPDGARTIDCRDQMHKRGWTYFTVEGHVDADRVSGVGRMPFVHEAVEGHYPWLRLQIGKRLTILDSGAESAVRKTGGRALAGYAPGTFFRGLARPWMGLHTIDIVRRDAAEKGVRFETALEPGEEKANVTLTCAQGKLIYTINVQADVVEKIELFLQDGRRGELTFTYLQNLPEEGAEFAEPKIGGYYRSRQADGPGILWLLTTVFNE